LSRIVITGIGIITAIGHNKEENRRSLINGYCGIGEASLLQSRYVSELPFGEVRISTNALQQKLNAFEKGVTRTSLLALHAFNEAVADAGLSNEIISDRSTAFINGNTIGGMCLTDELYHDANKDDEGSEYLQSYDCASISLYLQDKFALKGIINTINTACSSAANAIMFGARLIENGIAKRAIVGGTDSLAKFTINGFNALHILSNKVCTPFDESRQGLNLGEGAAYLILEKEEDAIGKNQYAALSGFCNANDAYHPSSLSENGDGPYLSMQGALDDAGLKPADIQYINAHGTGTENNDEVESRAMIRLFENPPAFSSTKANTGHTLGAAGAVEAVYSILSLQHQEIYPAVHFQQPIASTGLIPVENYKQSRLQHVMSNSFGFGGNCSSLIFSKC
jgi:3-oxoacyl-(acyl-carrier-protein) synthase